MKWQTSWSLASHVWFCIASFLCWHVDTRSKAIFAESVLDGSTSMGVFLAIISVISDLAAAKRWWNCWIAVDSAVDSAHRSDVSREFQVIWPTILKASSSSWWESWQNGIVVFTWHPKLWHDIIRTFLALKSLISFIGLIESKNLNELCSTMQLIIHVHHNNWFVTISMDQLFQSEFRPYDFETEIPRHQHPHRFFEGVEGTNRTRSKRYQEKLVRCCYEFPGIEIALFFAKSREL